MTVLSIFINNHVFQAFCTCNHWEVREVFCPVCTIDWYAVECQWKLLLISFLAWEVHVVAISVDTIEACPTHYRASWTMVQASNAVPRAREAYIDEHVLKKWALTLRVQFNQIIFANALSILGELTKRRILTACTSNLVTGFTGIVTAIPFYRDCICIVLIARAILKRISIASFSWWTNSTNNLPCIVIIFTLQTICRAWLAGWNTIYKNVITAKWTFA